MCGVELECLKPHGWHAAHNIAWTKGGSHEVGNRRVSCPTCNASTSTLNFDEQTKAREASHSATAVQSPSTKQERLQDFPCVNL
jgi:hypothetical protein